MQEVIDHYGEGKIVGLVPSDTVVRVHGAEELLHCMSFEKIANFLRKFSSDYKVELLELKDRS